MLYLHMLVLLLFGHALADYPFQGDFLANAKRGMVPGFPWWVGMAMHCFMHMGMVLVITGSVVLATAEFGMHFFIDNEKCQNRIGTVQDQVAHVLCKAVWAFLWVWATTVHSVPLS